jgi:hypothetical protein
MKDMFNQENRESVRSLFTLGRAFSREIPDFYVGTVIFHRDIEVRCSRTTTLNERNRLRKEEDRRQGERIRDLLNEQHLKFSTDDLLVLCQPGLDNPDLYWSSINDFVRFAMAIAQNRRPFTAKRLLDFFDEALPHIMAVTDFEHPKMHFEQILLNIVDRRLTEAKTYALSLLDVQIVQPIFRLSRADLRECPNIACVQNGKKAIVTAFMDRANDLHPHILEYCEERTKMFHQIIHQEITEGIRSACMKKAVSMLPELQTKCLTDLKERMQREISSMEVSAVDKCNFSGLCSERAKLGIEMLEAEARLLNDGVIATPEYRESAEKLRRDISEFLKELEDSKKAEYQTYRKKQDEKLQQEWEEKCERMVDKVRKEELENRRKLELEINQAIQKVAEETTRLRQEQATHLAIMIEAIAKAERNHQEDLRQRDENERQTREALQQQMTMIQQQNDTRDAQMREFIITHGR